MFTKICVVVGAWTIAEKVIVPVIGKTVDAIESKTHWGEKLADKEWELAKKIADKKIVKK